MKARSMFSAMIEALAEAHRDAGANRESLNTMRLELADARCVAGERLTKLMEIEREAKPRQERFEKLWHEAHEFVRIVEALVDGTEAQMLYEPHLTGLRAAVDDAERDTDCLPF